MFCLPKTAWPPTSHEFQMAIVTLAGNIVEWDDDEIVIAWEH